MNVLVDGGIKLMLKIRDAVIEDIPSMMEIYNDAVRNMNVTFDLKEKTLQDREKWFQKYDQNYPLIVAEKEGQVVGYCGLNQFREREGYAYTTELTIYISRHHRGNGIGSSLMKEILHQGKERGFHTVISGISNENRPSMKLHEKFGFQLIGVLREVGYKFGKWHDVHYYQRMLTD